LTGHMVANVFFTLSSGFWDMLAPEQRAAIEAAELAAKKVNDDGVIATEKDAAGFFEGKGVKVTTPDVAAFRDQVQKRFLESKFAAAWPKGMLERINKAAA
jgi:TRAP-type C4-dicarboxylate transport system substrate-binding protein